jgi:hypothetical protein
MHRGVDNSKVFQNPCSTRVRIQTETYGLAITLDSARGERVVDAGARITFVFLMARSEGYLGSKIDQKTHPRNRNQVHRAATSFLAGETVGFCADAHAGPSLVQPHSGGSRAQKSSQHTPPDADHARPRKAEKK